MSYFQRSAEYYILQVNLSGAYNRCILGERCRAKYPRGINLVAVDGKELGHTFAPDFMVDPGRIFLTYERLVKEALSPTPDESDPLFKEIKHLIDTYDPAKELLFLVLLTGAPNAEGYVYRVSI